MELDFKAIQALSSPTRIRILREVLDSEATPTGLSRELDKSKSTISSHLDTLVSAGLVEKDSKEGRKRVIYRPTSKAEAIVMEKERKVKFSLVSTAFTLVLGVSSLWYSREQFMPSFQSKTAQDAVMLSQEAAANATTAPSRGVDISPELLLFAGIGFLSLSALTFLYGLVMREFQ